MRTSLPLPAILAALALLALPPTASAATACAYDAASATVSVDYSGQGTDARLRRSATGAILLDGAPCGDATIRNTDLVRATGGAGPQQLVVDLGGGPFGPGKTPESDGISEIEIDVDAKTGGESPTTDQVRIAGSAAADFIRFARGGILLGGDADPDVLTTGVETWGADGGTGNDRLIGDDAAAGGPAVLELRLSGEAGQDELAGGQAGDTLDGGSGPDRERGGDGGDVFRQGPQANGADVIDGGGSPFDRVDYSERTFGVRISLDGADDDGEGDELDNVRDAVEYLAGGAGPDVLVASETRFQSFELRGNGGGDTLTGGTTFDALHGGDGADVMAGNAGSDTLHPGPGDDQVRGGEGADVIDEDSDTGPNGKDDLGGGTGVDTYLSRGRTAPRTLNLADDQPNDGEGAEGDNVRSDIETVFAGKGAERITGGPIANQLYGGPGDDTIAGGDGPDKLNGGTGGDTLRGDGGDDEVLGQEGEDTLLESAAPDGADLLDGGPDADAVSYAARTSKVAVRVDGTANDGAPVPPEGDDVRAESVSGGRAGDLLEGTSFADLLDGREGDDELRGWEDSDRLRGGAGRDVLRGGDGADVLDGSLGPDTLDGEDGADTSDYSARTEPVTVTLAGGADDGAAGERDDARTERVTGGSAADRLTGDNDRNVLDGSAGDDVLDGGRGPDTLSGGDGRDRADYGARTTRVIVGLDKFAEDGADADANGTAEERDFVMETVEDVTGGSGADQLTGSTADNRLEGGGGDDDLDGRLGADVLDGGAGRDVADYGSRLVAVAVTIDGAAGDGTDADRNGVGEENDRVEPSTEILHGGSGPDRLTGDRADNELRGNDGEDRLIGGAGSDVLAGGADADVASYEDHAADAPVKATIDGVADDGHAASGERDDVRTDVEALSGGHGDDELHGSAGNDVLDGGPAGKDALHGEGGDDRLDGQADPATPSTDPDDLWGGDGTDVADYGRRTKGLRLSVDGRANDGVPEREGEAPEGDNIHLDVENLVGGFTTDFMFGSIGPNRLDGGPGADVLTGGGGPDEVHGGPSKDRVEGGSGNDRLHGGPGDNLLLGGNGDDALVEAATAIGRDDFIGGGGRDIIDYSARSTPVVASDLGLDDDGEDKNADGFADERDDIGTDVEVIVGGSGDDQLKRWGWEDPAGLCGALIGGEGNDLLRGMDNSREALIGGPGADQLDGGRNDDVLSGGPGDDVETGGTGQDVFVQGAIVSDCTGWRYFTQAGGDGADTINGDDDDAVSYEPRTATVEVRLDSHANDGAPGEGDKVVVEDITGGSGNDILVGNGLDNSIFPGPGNDRAFGGSGGDIIVDRSGRDTLFGQNGSDTLRVNDGEGLDSVDGGSGISDTGEWDDDDIVKGM